MPTLLVTDVPASPLIPVSVYVDTDDDARTRAVVEGVEALVAPFEFSVVPLSEPELKSWFRRFRLKLRSAATSEEVTRRLEKVERGLQIAAVDRPQSEVDANQADAVAKLLAALEGIDDALIRVGSMVFVKSTDSTGRVLAQAWPLTVAELTYLEQHPELSRQPSEFLQRLTALSSPSPLS